jgi:hypothetical protein
MTRQPFARWTPRLVSLIGLVVMACGSANALAAKPIPAVWADVAITFGDQTYGFAGAQQQFTQAQDGGRILFDMTTLGTPGYNPLPQIDVSGLGASGNRWQVVARVGHRSYTFSGTCASLTFSSKEEGVTVRHLYLNCQSLDSFESP